MKKDVQHPWAVRRRSGRIAVVLSVLACSVAGLRELASADTVPGPAAHVPAHREAIMFRNGDLLYGTLDSMLPDTGIQWRHPDADGLIQFLPDNVSEIDFPARNRPAVPKPDTCRIQLNNGDQLEGDIVGFNPDTAVLQTWYAGEITLPRKVIESLVPVPPDGAVLYQGPTGLEGWTMGKVVSALGDAGEWQYKNGAFYATNAASIARKFQLPDVAILEFDLAWK